MEVDMDRHERDLKNRGINNSLEGKGKDIKGRIKDAAGGLTGDTELQAEGKWDRVKGKVQDKVGDVQRKVAEESRDEEF
jgi:uncharacterized protein YjbJ (UPF0337 family)